MRSHKAIQSNKKRALLVDVFPREQSRASAEHNLEEIIRLVKTAGGVIVVKVLQRRGRPSARTYVGKGKAEEIRQLTEELDIDIVIVNGMLKATQNMHLTEAVNRPVWDRVDVILDIFAQHARGAEAKLQVELARQKYELPKLYGRGIEFSRIAGGAQTKGPGEQYLEVQKRTIKKRVAELNRKLDQLKQKRNQQRQRRKRNMTTVALVGYTNAGKSSLLNILTNKDVLIADQLFSTLETRVGKLWLKQLDCEILVADTIGFISNLPPFLIASFRSTLEEVKQADLLLEVIDATDKNIPKKRAAVREALAELEALEIPRILVVNKIDMLEQLSHAQWRHGLNAKNVVFTSAMSKSGVKELKNQIAARLKA